MSSADLFCFSHLRWNFVFQRPNHLMVRFACEGRVFFIEEPVEDARDEPWLEQTEVAENLWRVIAHLNPDMTDNEQLQVWQSLLQSMVRDRKIRVADHWYYTPMMLPLGQGLPRRLVVYDCMDELSNFLNAPIELRLREQELLTQADIVFTGGMALYEAKRSHHRNVHGMPSSVDVSFFAQARVSRTEPDDQSSLGGPRIGYCGVIDERLDLDLIDYLSSSRPEWQLVMVGPVVKIDPESLPRRANIHYLGGKKYTDLPSYLSGWDVAIMPFALNDATRFISPTKTPEYLAAGRPVVSTAIQDVVEPYEKLGLVRIGRSFAEFENHIAAHLSSCPKLRAETDHVRDTFLAATSWDVTWRGMRGRMNEALVGRTVATQFEPTGESLYV